MKSVAANIVTVQNGNWKLTDLQQQLSEHSTAALHQQRPGHMRHLVVAWCQLAGQQESSSFLSGSWTAVDTGCAQNNVGKNFLEWHTVAEAVPRSVHHWPGIHSTQLTVALRQASNCCKSSTTSLKTTKSEVNGGSLQLLLLLLLASLSLSSLFIHKLTNTTYIKVNRNYYTDEKNLIIPELASAWCLDGWSEKFFW